MSHGDSDHISGIKELLEDRRIRYLVLPFGWDNRKGLSELGREAGEQGTEILELAQGDALTIGEMKMTCLWPEKAEESENEENEENERSMVLWLSWRDTDVLFTGDLEGAAEQRLAETDGERLWADVLKVGHHGSANGSGEAFLARVQPKAAVISCGRRNRYGHPASETVRRLEKSGSILFSTASGGAVQITTDGNSFWIRQKNPKNEII